jgi:signal transduction histidine kinase/HAMP domain-containing protein
MEPAGRPDEQPSASDHPPDRPSDRGDLIARPVMPLRILFTTLLIGMAVVPLALFGGVFLLISSPFTTGAAVPLLIMALAAAALVGLRAASFALAQVTGPLRRITVAVERVAAGEPGPPIDLAGDDELARLAESHNRIAAEVVRRNRELGELLTAVAAYSPGQGVASLSAAAERDACHIYALIDCRIELVDPASVPVEELIPGDPRPVRAVVRAGSESLGVLTGHLPATRSWERADQDLLDLFASQVGVALRNAELFGRVESQNARLLELDQAKDEFLRGVSHNLQTPLTSIRAYVDQLRAESTEAARDRRLAIVAEQSDRLTRLVRQLLTVTRLEAGALLAQAEVIALAPRVRRAWEALNPPGVAFELRDDSHGWLAVADPDQLDQVLWALLDNAVKYGGPAGAVEVRVGVDEAGGRLLATIADHGAGVSEADRDRLFARFSRGSGQGGGDGTGLGLYVSRQLLRGMGGDLWLEPSRPGLGAEFTLALHGEPPGDGA